MEDESVLERRLNGTEEPTDLPLPLLEHITKKFSKERIIGRGGFGAVYKGVLQNGIIVAVKRIDVNVYTLDGKSFRREFDSLMYTNHENVVRFLGFCSNTHKISIKDAGTGKNNLVNVNERLLCLEYISNGSLDDYITDELRGLEWKTRYEIITGICTGLCYLHTQKRIIHMDLKPGNVLLDDHMVPKITDFGLSRPEENSHTMGQCFGTPGYIAPEYKEDGITSLKCDIYSLGVIMTELVTGCKGVPNINNVLRRWRHRWNKPPTVLQFQQVTSCINIAVRCRHQKPEARPSIGDIMSILSESESGDGHTGQENTYLEDDMLGIEPLELQFAFKLNTEMSYSVKLTNKTKAFFAFNIERPSQQYTIRPDKGIVPPECNKYLVQITVQPQERLWQITQNADKFIMQSTKVSEGLRVKDITEHIFHEKVGKVVDEVSLMVTYETGSRKRGQDPNVQVEAVSPKRKAMNSSSYEDGVRGQCPYQQDRRNFHPPENFSHSQPTNMTYLLRVSDQAMDVTRGAMGSLLHKLGELLKEDFNLEASVKKDVQSLSEELVKMQLVLHKLSEVQQGNLDDLVKRWASNVREMSYDLEDFVDGFLVNNEPDSNTSGFGELTHELCLLLDKGKSHHPIGNLIKHHITKQVQVQTENLKDYNVDNVVTDAAATITDNIDPRMLVVFQHQKELVGIQEPRDNLIRRLSQVDGDLPEQQLRIFSIYGPGGSGKTTLVKAVYDTLKSNFHLMAFVSVGRYPDKKQVLRDILDELDNNPIRGALNEKQLIKELHTLFKNKRYFIVIDDIWDSSVWGIIKYAFPENNLGSRVVTTTRIHSVAVACCNGRKYVCEMETLSDRDSRRLFLSRIFGLEDACPDVPEDILTIILKKCGGLPLAIISIASLVAKDPRRRSTWDYVRKSLIAMFEQDNSTLRDMEQILDLSYRHLPNHLKTCLLSVGKYREDQEIEKVELLRQWIAEGFVVSTTRGLDVEDVAENYLNELINMCMIQPGKVDKYNNEMLSCRVHDIVLDLMRSKSRKENFTHVIDGWKDGTCAHGKMRRISVQYSDKDDSEVFETIKGSLLHARSALFYQVSPVPYLLVFKYIRVLHIESMGNDMDLDVTSITRLFFLRYLKIKHRFRRLKLPDQIGELQQLETVDTYGIYPEENKRIDFLWEYPSDIASLSRLLHLRYVGVDNGFTLPEGVERLKSLRTLEGVNLYESSVENIKGLGKLTNLRTLKILQDVFKESEEATTATRIDAFLSSISILSASLRILTLGNNCRFPHGCNQDIPPGWNSRTLFPGGSNIGELNLGCFRFERCPGWISQLHNLYKFSIMVREVADAVSIVAWLPSLSYFKLQIFGFIIEEEKEEDEKEESIVVPGGGAFKSLKHLSFYCRKASLSFEAEAVPKLEKLYIEFRYEMTPQLIPVGIQHLPAPTLKKIWLLLDEGSMEVKVKGSEDWDDYKWERYWDSYKRIDKKTKHDRKLKAMLQKAFKKHHPGADIDVSFHGCNQEYLGEYSDEEYCDEDDNKEEDDEEHYFTEEDDQSVEEEDYYSEEDDEASYQVNGSQTLAQVQANIRQLVQVIEAHQDSGRKSINTDAPPMVDMSPHLAVRLQGWQSRRDQAFIISEALQLSFTAPLTPWPSPLHLTPYSLPDMAERMANFHFDINNDLSVEQGNNDSMLVNAVAQDLNLDFPPCGLVDLNEAPNEHFPDTLQMELSTIMTNS